MHPLVAASTLSERHERDLSIGSGEAPEILWVAACDHGGFKFERRCDDECVDRVNGGHARCGEQRAGALRHQSRQVNYPDGVSVQELVDGRVQSTTATDFGKDWRWNPHEGATLVGNSRNGACPESEGTATSRVNERIEGLGV